jgi:hypothetical protein
MFSFFSGRDTVENAAEERKIAADEAAIRRAARMWCRMGQSLKPGCRDSSAILPAFDAAQISPCHTGEMMGFRNLWFS